MRPIHAAGTLMLAALAGPLAAQPAPGAMGDMPGHAMPAPDSAAIPAAPVVPADSPAAAALPPTAPTTVNNTLPPPPAAALNKSYPVCTGTMTDNCQNPGEGGAPGRSRSSNVKRHHHHPR